jgi:hypothetical protein
MRKIIIVLLRILVSGTFAASALAKAVDFPGTAGYVSGLFQIDDGAARAGLSLLICLEAAVAILMVFGRENILVYRTVLSLLTVFAVLNVRFMLAGVSNCGCMGTTIASSPLQSLSKTLFMMTAVYIIHHHSHPSSASIDNKKFPRM